MDFPDPTRATANRLCSFIPRSKKQFSKKCQHLCITSCVSFIHTAGFCFQVSRARTPDSLAEMSTKPHGVTARWDQTYKSSCLPTVEYQILIRLEAL